MSDSLWDTNRVNRYIELYGDPREKKGSQSNLCKDVAAMISGGSILDVGCGMGHLLAFLEGRIYFGWDYSPTMLEKLTEFFPEAPVIQGDATLPYDEFKSELEHYVLRPISTVVSVSLFIHLPTIDDVKATLRNMWNTATKEIVFGVETMGDTELTRASGLKIRNISVDHILNILQGEGRDELGVPRENITWFHQQMTYKQQTIIHPNKSSPMAMTPPQLFQRTTLFHVRKE